METQVAWVTFWFDDVNVLLEEWGAMDEQILCQKFTFD